MKKLIILLVMFLTLIIVSCNKTVNTYDVTFYDNDGNIIETVKVEEGKSVTPPTAPNIEFYRFDGWDQDLNNIKSNLTVKPIYNKITNYRKSAYKYWLSMLIDKYDIYAPLMTLEEIKEYNNLIVKGNLYTDVVDVLSLDNELTSSEVSALIYQYSKMNKYTVYDDTDNSVLTSEEKEQILLNRNLDNIDSNVICQYGIITDFARMRAYPTNAYSNSYSRDQFQETSLNVGEVVMIYHTSLDGLWYYVQATNYIGWIETKNVGLCSMEEASSFVNPDKRLVVIDDYVKINNSHVRMGQSFPLVSDETEYIIKFPTRDNDNSLKLIDVNLSKSSSYNVGYLTYNYENLYRQAFKLLNISYSWGDKEELGRDCSSTQNAIYSCFGFVLPRNTGNQKDIPSYGKSFSSITINQLKQDYLPGTLIFSSGHVMMYIGEDLDGVSYILHNTSAGDGKCILQSISDYGINKIIGTLRLQ